MRYKNKKYCLVLILLIISMGANATPVFYDIRTNGAKGDGIALDTKAINDRLMQPLLQVAERYIFLQELILVFQFILKVIFQFSWMQAVYCLQQILSIMENMMMQSLMLLISTRIMATVTGIIV